jgi:hypothetical protein
MSRKLGSWVLAYCDAVKNMTEAPDAYNVWSAISVISSVLKKRCWIYRGTYKIYPNQYIVLVGPPGVGKGTAIHPAHSFSKLHKPPLSNYMSDRITAPKIIERLAQGFATTSVVNGQIHSGIEASCTLQAAELSSFLSSSDWMTTFLCDAWDRNEYEYDTRNKGTFTIKDMCVGLIGACVPEFIRSINKDMGKAINGGFTARTIFVFAGEKSKSIVWPQGWEANISNKKLYDDLAHDLEYVARVGGQFSWEPRAQIEFERTYNSIVIDDNDTEVVKHFKARQATHICKVAMTLSAASRDDAVIDHYSIRTAIALVKQIADSLNVTFRGVGESPLAEATARIQAYIERKGLVSKQEVIRDNYRHITNDDLDRVIFTLAAIGFLECITMGGKAFYKHLIPKGNKP